MKKIVSSVMLFVLLLSLCACSSEPTLIGTTPTSNPTTEATEDVSKQEFGLGDTVELDDVVVSFLDITTSTGSDFNKPADGKIFVLCEFEITNNSPEELAVSSMLSFEAYCDDYSCDYSVGALMEKGEKSQLDGAVASGKKMKGVIGYEVPTDWKELEIQYTVDILSDDKIVFLATNN